MALNFPNNPSVNDTVELGGKTFQYDGVKWRMVYVVTPTPPTAQALAPTITEVSNTDTEIVFTITNNDASTAVILYEVDDATPDENSVELAAAATSSNITITGLTEDVEYDVYATANVTGKVKSNVTELAITTVEPLVYTAATGGTTEEYDDGGTRYKSHTFTSNGNFVVSTVGDATGDLNKVDYLIIAGGGGGGASGSGTTRGGGGGGAGGYETTLGSSGGNTSAVSKVTVTAQGYSIVIGAGGAQQNNASAAGNNGNNSTGLGETLTGGGGGGGDSASSNTGGSGGGGGGRPGFTNGASGTTNQGTSGGDGNVHPAGGGGGSQTAGSNGSVDSGGAGGAGLANLLRTGSNETRAGGGGGAGDNSGTGGSGGGGNGSSDSAIATAGTANTGSGGGGGRGFDASRLIGRAGGSGIVVIRYEIAPSV